MKKKKRLMELTKDCIQSQCNTAILQQGFVSFLQVKMLGRKKKIKDFFFFFLTGHKLKSADWFFSCLCWHLYV